MTTVFLVGAGAVGRRAAWQLAETEGVEHILVADRVHARADEAADVLGSRARVVDWSPDDRLPPGVGVVAVAVNGSSERAIAERAIEAGVPMAGCADDSEGVRSLLDLDDAAREAGVALAVGCGLAPGLSDVLARHAANVLEVVEEVHVARAGSAGAACLRSLDRSGRGAAFEWRDRAWVRQRAGSGRQLVWFPAPVGSRDCRRAGSGQAPLLVDALPRLTRVSMRVASATVRRSVFDVMSGLGTPAVPGGPDRRRRDLDGEWGAVCVEVRGRRGRSEEILVYGAVDRMAFAAGTVLTLAALWLAGLGPAPVTQVGAHGLGALVDPVLFLGELARRGVKAAVFEGVSGS